MAIIIICMSFNCFSFQYLLASSYIPVLTGSKQVYVNGKVSITFVRLSRFNRMFKNVRLYCIFSIVIISCSASLLCEYL